MRVKLIICGRNDGLGARLKNFLITRVIADYLKVNHLMYWATVSRHCSCNFELLFNDNSINIVNVKKKKFGDNIDLISVYIKDKWGLDFNELKVCKVWDERIITEKMLNENDVLLLCNSHFYKLYNYEPNFGIEMQKLYKSLKLSDNIMKQIKKHISLFKSFKMIGIHVRRGECVTGGGGKQQARGNVSLDKFFNILDSDYMDKEYMYFVCSDDAKVQKQFRKKYNHPKKNGERHIKKVFTYPERSLDRTDPRAIEDAFVIMNLLTKCNKIYGCHSAFNKLPALFGGVERHLIE